MDFIIKKASELSPEEQAALGITGIPADWPIEVYPYNEVIPDKFIKISDTDMELLKANNQAAYDAWLQALRPLPQPPAPTPVTLTYPTDEQGKPYFTQSVTNTEWYYSPHSLDFYTAKYKSLYNRKHDGNGIDDGTDMADAYLSFYDAEGVEIVHGGYEETDEGYQARLTAGCVKTVMTWEKIESFDVVGAQLYIANQPVGRAYLWVIAAPDIPYEYGGSKAFMGRGMNLQMMRDKSVHNFDAKTSKTVHYDPVYHSGKVSTIVKHAVGEQIGIQIIFVLYEE